MTAKTKNAFQIVITQQRAFQREHLKSSEPVLKKNPSLPIEDIICISTCVDQSSLVPARTENDSQNVLSKPSLTNEDTKCNLNKCWSNSSIAWEEILTYVHKIVKYQRCHKMKPKLCLTSPSNASKYKMYLHLGWLIRCRASEVTISILTYVDQKPEIPAKTQNLSQLNTRENKISI